MGFYILGYKQPHAAPPGAPRITRSRASPCPPAAPPDPAVAYILGYMDGFQMWRSGLSRRPHSAAAVTPSAPKPRTPSQRSRHDIPARPAVRFPPLPSRHSRQSLALRPSVRVTTSRFVPPPALRRPRHTVRAPAACAASRVAHRASPAPHLIEATRVSCDLRPLETLAFCAAAQVFGAPEGSVSPVGCCAKRKATRRREQIQGLRAASAQNADICDRQESAHD